MPETTSRQQAIGVLRDGHSQVIKLVSELTEEAVLRPGLGGGDWSVKDLLGHLTSWEEHALGAIDAWLNQEATIPPIYQALEKLGLDGVNQQTLTAKSRQSYSQVLENFNRVHRQLLAALVAIEDERWIKPPTPEAKRTLRDELGGILAGQGPFDHADVHLPDLRAWVAALA